MKQYIFNKDHQSWPALNSLGQPLTGNFPVAVFEKGKVYPLEVVSFKDSNGVKQTKYYSISNFQGATHYYRVPLCDIQGCNPPVISPYNIKNSIKNDTMASSYLGENVISQDKEENLKNAFAVIGALFIAIIIYVYIMEFKNLQ
jgi:hypothetical protein